MGAQFLSFLFFFWNKQTQSSELFNKKEEMREDVFDK